MNIDPDWIATSVVAVVGAGVMAVHIRGDRAHRREMQRQTQRFNELDAQLQALVDKAQERMK